MGDCVLIDYRGPLVSTNAAYKKTRTGIFYMSKEGKAMKELIALSARRAMRGRELFGGNVGVTIDIWFRTGRNDVDGPVKLILDSLNDIVWNDDRQIKTYTVSKYIAEDSRNVGCQIQVTEAGA